MNKSLIGCITASLLAVLSNSACAAYFGVGFGDTAADMTSSSGQAINYSSTGIRLVGGNQISQYLAVEAEYIDLGKFTSETSSIAAKGLGISGLLAMPVSTSIAVFGKAGFARIETTATANPGTTLTTRDSDTRIGLSLGYGVTLDVAANASVRVSWDRYKTSALAGPFTDRVDSKTTVVLLFKY
jgi:opacity protein-like surface antigen